MSKLFLDRVLTAERKHNLAKLTPFFVQFTLCGGTGLALQWGHRISNDFDLFTSFPLPRFFSQKVGKVLDIASIAVDTSDELTLFTKDNVKVTFLIYPFASIEHDVIMDTIRLGSVADLVANKCYTLGRRVEIRDYIDVYESLKHQSLSISIKQAKKKYGNLFDEKLFLGQLGYFDGLQYDDPTFADYGVTQSAFESELTKAITEYLP
ncbi:MAG TPA: nucleotidyl transferase AbiEii/AbiGii toxin family protein [Candidatus Woesebacteria bacterium]|jgi:hypothetical protein|nr:nucleotidyl transferase AbiEii/AbiGii toxin family protein [Candidatus Woesebacteria bacterium]HNS94454.1 nucleotidyl transferase AbiEii/AbiGii toxin family protein [Candidatus Woesebacteria bacterium]